MMKPVGGRVGKLEPSQMVNGNGKWCSLLVKYLDILVQVTHGYMVQHLHSMNRINGLHPYICSSLSRNAMAAEFTAAPHGNKPSMPHLVERAIIWDASICRDSFWI